MNKPTIEEQKLALQSAIFRLVDNEAFFGALLQELTIKYKDDIPAPAGISFNQKTQQFEIFLQPEMFAKFPTDQRAALLHHEILHFTNKHLFRLPFLSESVSNEDKRLYNIAGDMAINQLISNLPAGTVNVNDWKKDDGTPFEKLQTMEHYFGLIKEQMEQQKKNKNTKGNVNEQVEKFTDFDQHAWEKLDEETKQQMLEEAKKVLKRTIEKTSYTHSSVPDSIRDLLQEIEVLGAALNYRQILRNTIKKTVSSVDREATWKKPSKRYGSFAPGTKLGVLPNLTMYADSSGSISAEELNLFFSIINEFLKVGTRNCWLGLWHTNLYYKKKYKLNKSFNREEVESGGTDVSCVLEDIKKSNPNLAIIITDGYYSTSSIKVKSEVIWIISKNGNINHPMKHVGKTIMLDKIK